MVCTFVVRKPWINFLEKLFQEYHQSQTVYNLYPDQAQHFVGPVLGPNCLQMLSAGDTSTKVKSQFEY